MRRDGDETATGRYTVHEAALMLGLSVDAVRKRAERGTLKREKGEDGAVYVLLDSTQTGHASNSDKSDDGTATGQRLVAVLEEQVEHLRLQLEIANEANRENRRIIMALTQRVPALEAAQGDQDGAREPRHDGGVVEDGEGPEKRSWWRRLFDV